jgi:aldehyde dehydrogenase (NAD+)
MRRFLRFVVEHSLTPRDVGKPHANASGVRAGTAGVNCFDVFDAAAPFGGFEQSGIGREMGRIALQQYTEIRNRCRETLRGRVSERVRCLLFRIGITLLSASL